MASLVADYGTSSSSDTDSDAENQTSSHVTKTLDAEDQQNEESVKGLPLTNPFIKLPTPSFGAGGTVPVKNSVFSNPFREAEDAKKAILEKHVKLTPTLEETKTINGKQICWNYRKGRCRFGHNCKYAHDSDLHRDSLQEGESLVDDQSGQGTLQLQAGPGAQEELNLLTTATEEEDSANPPKKKKRAGLGEGLVPNKKTMAMYREQQRKESPWLISSKASR